MLSELTLIGLAVWSLVILGIATKFFSVFEIRGKVPYPIIQILLFPFVSVFFGIGTSVIGVTLLIIGGLLFFPFLEFFYPEFLNQILNQIINLIDFMDQISEEIQRFLA